MKANCVFPAAIATGAGPAVSGARAENVARTAHHATILPKGQFKRFRTHKHRFGPGVHVVWGIKPRSKAGPRGGVVFVHALLFDKKRFTPATAKLWLKAHDYTAKKFKAATPLLKKAPAKRRTKATTKRRTKTKRRVANMLPEGIFFQYIAQMNPADPSVPAVAVAPGVPAVVVAPAGKAAPAVAVAPVKVPAAGAPVAPTAKQVAAAVKKNPSLMILMNPAGADTKEQRLANKAFKSFHFHDSTKQAKRNVPDDWPKTSYWELGWVDRFDAKDASGKTVSRTFRGKKPILAATKTRRDVFVIAQNGKLKIPSGIAMRIDYTVPKTSGRNKWSRRWWHAHESNPKVKAHSGGRHARITGPGLSITPRGIIG